MMARRINPRRSGAVLFSLLLAGCAQVIGIDDFALKDGAGGGGGWGSGGGAPVCGEPAGALCCPGPTCNGALICVAGTCQPCGEVDTPCCGGITCNGALICVADTCRVCGANGASCCPGNTCDPGLECSNGTCADICGSPNQPCCPGATLCDGGMACVSGTCMGSCTVRCKSGEYMYSKEPRTSEADCATWGSFACTNYAAGAAAARIRYNGTLVGGTGACGGYHEAACEVSPVCDAGLTAKQFDISPPSELGVAPNVAVHPSTQYCE